MSIERNVPRVLQPRQGLHSQDSCNSFSDVQPLTGLGLEGVAFFSIDINALRAI